MAKLVWITGLSGSGKTTIGKEVYKEFKKTYSNTVFLDGDSFRKILGNDLGHNQKDRLSNAMRISRMCKFLTSQDINVICATMSLFKEAHDYNRANNKDYFEIFIDVPMEELIKRDPKGLYKKALANEETEVVGVNLPFDKPQNFDLRLDNTKKDKFKKNISLILDLIKGDK